MDYNNVNLYANKFKYDIINQYYNCTTWINKNKKANLVYKYLCNAYIKHNKNTQIGGNLGIDIQIIFGLFALFVYCYYNGYTHQQMNTNIIPFSKNFSAGSRICKKHYPLYDKSKVPSPGEIIAHFVPHTWLVNARKMGHSDEIFISNSLDTLDKINNVLSIFDPTQGNTFERIVKSGITVAVSATAAVGTEGTVGSNVANIPKYMASGISMITKMIDKLVTIINDITTVLQAAETVIDTADHLIDDALSKDKKTRKYNDTQQQLNFLYDIFNVDFRGGPFHCRCWVKYLVKLYMGSEAHRDQVKALFCIMNDIYVSLNAEIIGFIGSTLDVLIPDAMGLFGIASQFVGQYSYEIYRMTLKGLLLAYDQVPVKYKKIIQHPVKFKRFAFAKLRKYTLGLSNVVMTKNMKHRVGMLLDVISNGLYKGISLTFTFLNLFIIFSELQAGLYKLDPKEMFNANKINMYCSNDNGDTNNKNKEDQNDDTNNKNKEHPNDDNNDNNDNNNNNDSDNSENDDTNNKNKEDQNDNDDK